ncbi:LysM peptidoglycan-binding domain-containing protein [Dyadobacter sp. LHD-138]|uniref:LysM peptidoglycan-binding domain-containing protein n=1 Tax=Dyadobacter sp. LHD-138 TaxID=3071413 RepID=UPI0027DFE2C0|nr:LysM peptidoglycan-binding domain-containing protein [Dyadobacter sp. LHD-138]MDQ6476788.1 LysM peptidoglycan-binding domain-containing protein [Dyadobacter sp. LHD-138]
MEDDSPKKRNIRPTEKSNLPVITLFVLVLLVLAMLYVGYEYISDGSSNSEELTSSVVDTTENKTVAESTTEEDAAEEEDIVKETPKPAEKKEEKKEKKEEPKKEEPKKTEDPKVIASRVGGKEITRTVKSGETFSSLASRYNLTTETLKGLNPSITELKSGDKLKIRVKAVHTVGPGDILKVVSGKYDVSKEAIMKANGKTKDMASRGEELVIPFPTRR